MYDLKTRAFDIPDLRIYGNKRFCYTIGCIGSITFDTTARYCKECMNPLEEITDK